MVRPFAESISKDCDNGIAAQRHQHSESRSEKSRIFRGAMEVALYNQGKLHDAQGYIDIAASLHNIRMLRIEELNDLMPAVEQAADGNEV